MQKKTEENIERQFDEEETSFDGLPLEHEPVELLDVGETVCSKIPINSKSRLTDNSISTSSHMDDRKRSIRLKDGICSFEFVGILSQLNGKLY